MGSSQSAIVKALEVAIGDKSLVAGPKKPLYQSKNVKRYNLAIPVTPAVVTYPKTSAQVAAIIKCAVDAGLKVAPRSGGHSYANHSIGGADGSVVIDLKHFQQFSMDRKTWRATVGAGTLLGDATKRMYEAGGRAMAHGTCPQVGIGGHATIGGLGPSSRLWGTCLDHIEEVEVVTADATIKRASATENADLFWALKGAGASFGVITEFVCRTEPAPQKVIQFSYTFNIRPFSSMAWVFKEWQAYVAQPTLTRKFASQAIFMELGMIVSGIFYGSRAEFDAMQLEKKFPGAQAAQIIELHDWLSLAVHWGEDLALKVVGGIASPFYAKTLTFNGADLIPDKTIDKFMKFLDKTSKGTPIWFVIFDLAGGAVNDIHPQATAYAHRDALFYLQSYGVALSADGKVSKKLRTFLKNVNLIFRDGCDTGTDFGSYAGYVDPELKNPQASYWRYNLPRLEQIKAIVDPTDVFHNPQSVRPAGQVASASRLKKKNKKKTGTHGRIRLLLARLL